MASSISETQQDELSKQFETWFVERIKGADQNLDTGIFINYILTTLSTDDTSDEEKLEAILPFLQELNQNEIFDEENFLKEVMLTWNQMKTEFEKRPQSEDSIKNKENPTDTILNMISQHKTQLVKEKHLKNNDIVSEANNFVYVESDEDSESRVDKGLFVNKNAEDALSREKLKRDKIAENSKNQKEQAKRALVEQRQKEEERKKKAQQKAAKVERKR